MPAVRRTYPGLFDVAPEATEFIALFIVVCASVIDVAFMDIVLCAHNAQGIVVKLRNVTRNRYPKYLLNIVPPLGWIFIEI